VLAVRACTTAARQVADRELWIAMIGRPRREHRTAGQASGEPFHLPRSTVAIDSARAWPA
jgi:hypothetical protein